MTLFYASSCWCLKKWILTRFSYTKHNCYQISNVYSATLIAFFAEDISVRSTASCQWDQKQERSVHAPDATNCRHLSTILLGNRCSMFRICKCCRRDNEPLIAIVWLSGRQHLSHSKSNVCASMILLRCALYGQLAPLMCGEMVIKAYLIYSPVTNTRLLTNSPTCTGMSATVT